MTEKDKIPGTANAGDPSKFSAPPQGYFEGLESSIMQKIKASQEMKPHKRKLIPLRIWLPLAAAAMIIAGIFIFKPSMDVQPSMSLQSELSRIPDEEIVAVLMTESWDEKALADDINANTLFNDSSFYQQSELLEEELESDPNIELLIEEL
jgi:hypothetical protein